MKTKRPRKREPVLRKRVPASIGASIKYSLYRPLFLILSYIIGLLWCAPDSMMNARFRKGCHNMCTPTGFGYPCRRYEAGREGSPKVLFSWCRLTREEMFRLPRLRPQARAGRRPIQGFVNRTGAKSLDELPGFLPCGATTCPVSEVIVPTLP